MKKIGTLKTSLPMLDRLVCEKITEEPEGDGEKGAVVSEVFLISVL